MASLTQLSPGDAVDRLLNWSSDGESDENLLSSDEEEALDADLHGDNFPQDQSSPRASQEESSSSSSDEEPEQAPHGRGRGQGRGRGRGRARGAVASVTRGHSSLRGRGRAARQPRGGGTPHAAAANVGYSQWGNPDNHDVPEFQFSPTRPAGLHLPDDFEATCELDFFKLFMSDEVFDKITQYTNDYAWMHIISKPSYALPDGSWDEVTRHDLEKLVAFLIYMGLVQVPNYENYWSTATLYNGLWGRAFFPRDRLKAILAFLHVDDVDRDPNDRLRKVRYIFETVKSASQKFYQPQKHVSIDERMIRFKGRHSMKVYIKDKPTKWGFKVFALCDSMNSYNWTFEIYTGEQPAQVSAAGKTHDLVMRLFNQLRNQGYSLYTDNYYTSHALANTLLSCNSHLVGTVRSNRTGFPQALKNVKDFEKKGKRGDIRYVVSNSIAYVQWLDKRVVTVLSTKHRATDQNDAQRTVRVNNQWVQQSIKRPAAIADYNTNMGGVDAFDQLASSYRLLRRSKKSWRCIFYDLVECIVINSYLLFVEYKSLHPDALPRIAGYSQDNFRAFLVRQLADIDADEPPPLAQPGRKRKHKEVEQHGTHLPVADSNRGNCALCYQQTGKEQKASFCCSVCKNMHGRPLFLCIRPDRQCFRDYHQQL